MISQFTNNDSIAAMNDRKLNVKSEGRPIYTERRQANPAGDNYSTTGRGGWGQKNKWNKKKTWKRNKRQPENADGDDSDEDEAVEVTRTMYDDEPLDHEPRDEVQNADSNNSRRSNMTMDESISNLSRAKSQLSDKLMKELDLEDYRLLSKNKIEIESVVEHWPTYFNEQIPPFNQKNYRQSLSITILVGLIEDHQAENLKYLIWIRKKNDNFTEAVISLAKRPDGRPSFGARLTKVFDYLHEFPTDILGSLGVALHIFNVMVLQNKSSHVRVRLSNMLSSIKVTSFPSLTASKIHRFLLVKGRVTLMNPPKLLVNSAVYTCQDCRNSFVRHFKDGLFSQPTKCESEDCSSKSFVMDKTKCQVTAMQRFVIQETSAENHRFMGLVNCEVHGPLMSQIKLNKIAVIAGIWKIEPAAKVGNKAVSNKGMYDHYLEVNGIEYLETAEDTGFPVESQAKFKDMVKEVVTYSLVDCPLSFYVLIGSFCPNIQGQELAKACIILALAGGVNPKELFPDDSERDTSGAFRDNIHLLLLGERGIGKTELLKYVESLSANSKFIIIKTTISKVEFLTQLG